MNREQLQVDKKIIASIFIMGLGQILSGQIGKGLIYLSVYVGGIVLLLTSGIHNIKQLISLGSIEANTWTNQAGDNSVIILLMGILTLMGIVFFILCYISNINDVYQSNLLLKKGRKLNSIRRDITNLLDKNFHKGVLFLPIIGVLVFNILPIIFMISIAFTNYGGSVVPPKLVDWVGFENFIQIITLTKFAPTFGKILSWNIIWAVTSTFLNYFAGLSLALLLNKKCVKGKVIWRAFPILAYAVPGFITLFGFRFMFSYGGPVNQIITEMGHYAIGFLDIDSKWIARLIGLLVNVWISTPAIMLLSTGILANLDEQQFESARIDGASRWMQFIKITMPFMLFSTTPVLISQFIGNFNNFGIFYFLRGGLYLEDYFLASDTDLLINWLYNLSINNNYYNIGATISIVIFAITSFISLMVYVKSPSYKEEDTFR